MKIRPVKFDLAWRVALLLIFVLAVESPGEPPVTIGPPQTVITNNPKAGVHTRLTDEGAPWKIQRNLQLVRELGTRANPDTDRGSAGLDECGERRGNSTCCSD